MNWPSVLKACSQRIRGEVLTLFGSARASVGFGIGAGGDTTRRIDLVAEKALIEVLNECKVSCILISEESGVVEIGDPPHDFYVIADPLDGTTNAIRGLPFMATSIAVSKTPKIADVETALVLDILRNLTYTAQKGKGAFRDNKRIQPSSTTSLEEAVIGIDFNTINKRKIFTRLEGILNRSKHTRHLGANALEICYVADGTTDAFFDLRKKLRVTDIAAAYLILREAGGNIFSPEGSGIDVQLDIVQNISFIATSNIKLYEIIMGFLYT